MLSYVHAAAGSLQGLLHRRRVARLYSGRDYLDAYAAHTDLRVRADGADEAIGGMWEELGALQFEFLKGEGLRPHHRLLDVGCGSLRGGRHFIRYLDAGRYVGVDISEGVLGAAHDLVEREGLRPKRPRLLLNETKRLDFSEVAASGAGPFDYLLAQSVFTHLMPEHIEECVRSLPRVLAPGGAFYFTFNEGAHQQKARWIKGFKQPFSFYEDLAGRHGYRVERVSAEAYPHPRGQKMVRLTAPS